jgi:hypothetical protein
MNIELNCKNKKNFWKRVAITPSCWLWMGEINNDGYGRFTIRKNHALAHRFSYEMLVGYIPEGLQIDHLCKVRNCLNPNHLEPVTSMENTRRSKGNIYNSVTTHCMKGHEYLEENIYQRPNGSRECLTCKQRNAHLQNKK